MPVEGWESPVERAIREARERGEFDNLPGAGKPLPPIDPNDTDWFVRQLATREQLDFTGALPPAVALRKEAAGFPESLRGLRTEASVRAVLEDFNERVRQDRLRPTEGPLPRMLAPTVDVDALVEQWGELREHHSHGAPAGASAGTPTGTADGVEAEAGEVTGSSGGGRTAYRRLGGDPWWRRLLRPRKGHDSANS